MIGKRLAHYEITGRLGEGGMGVVYRARDTRLERDVALKVLPPALASDAGRLERFAREAKIVAGLNHPSIVTLHSIEEADGVHFLTMELVDGKSLDRVVPRGGLELARLFDLAIPIADAMAAAHEAGVVHRDLKPANVMVSRDGRVKVLDFGLARLDPAGAAATHPAATAAPTEAITGEGLVLGTVQYMSPEQARGEPADARSDIFALGTLLYEMATGTRPFAGASSAELVSAILRDRPRPLSDVRAELPYHFGRIVQRCLEKDPRRRYQAALDVRNELEGLQREVDSGLTRPSGEVPTPPPRRRRLPAWAFAAAAAAALLVAALALWPRGRDADSPVAAPPAAAARKKLVVLPFENLGPTEDAYFAAGMTEELTSRLARVGGLSVIARSSAQRYAGTELPMERIGAELGVDYAVEGRVRWAKSPDGTSRVRITPQLVEVADATQIWSGEFERELEDVFSIQAEIAGQVIEQLGVALLARERAAVEERPTRNMEAYQAWLQGLEHWQIAGYDTERFELAAQLFERAAALDPGYLQPLTDLVGVYGVLYFGPGDSGYRDKMRSALDRAIALAPAAPSVEMARGNWNYFVEKDYDAALARFESAAAQLPSDTHPVEMMGYIRRRQGRLEEAVALLEQTLELSPYVAHTCHELGRTYEALRRFEQAESYYRRGIALEPDSRDLQMRLALLQVRWRGDLEAARAICETAPTRRDFRGLTPLEELAWLERDWSGIRRRVEGRKGGWASPAMEARDRLELVEAYRRLGEHDLARRELEGLVALVRSQPLAGEAHPWKQVTVGLVEAWAGDRERAIAAFDRAEALIGPDRFAGPELRELRAAGLTALGDHDAAIEVIEELLAGRYDWPLTVPMLRLDPIWDPLRDHPRFQALVGSSG